MSNEQTQDNERSTLMDRARKLGLEFSNNIGTDTLRDRVNAVLEPEEVNPLEEEKPVKQETLRQKQQREQLKLIRCRITNLDPKKKDLQGEIITVANEYIGSIRKFVPFGEVTENGYHIPYVIYKMLKKRQFLQIRTRRDKRTGTEIVENQYVREFAIEVLEPLTPEEIKDLATVQAARGD